MRKAGAALGLTMILAACGGRATVVSYSPDALTMQWDANTTSPAVVTRQADGRCDPQGFVARRAIPIADKVDGSIHTTRYVCKQLNGGV